jgi:hypothetical protein
MERKRGQAALDILAAANAALEARRSAEWSSLDAAIDELARWAASVPPSDDEVMPYLASSLD